MYLFVSLSSAYVSEKMTWFYKFQISRTELQTADMKQADQTFFIVFAVLRNRTFRTVRMWPEIYFLVSRLII